MLLGRVGSPWTGAEREKALGCKESNAAQPVLGALFSPACQCSPKHSLPCVLLSCVAGDGVSSNTDGWAGRTFRKGGLPPAGLLPPISVVLHLLNASHAAVLETSANPAPVCPFPPPSTLQLFQGRLGRRGVARGFSAPLASRRDEEPH